MPTTLPMKSIRFNRPSGVLRSRVTARKYAAVPVEAGIGYHVEPRERMRPIVAAMGSEGNFDQLMELSEPFLDGPEDLNGLTFLTRATPDELLTHKLLNRVAERFGTHGIAASVRPRPVHRLSSREFGSYPLRRTQLVVFNREQDRVTAELKEVSDVLKVQGVGVDEDDALRDLERQFDALVTGKVRVPPHSRLPRDDHVRAVVDHLVDWPQFDRENPAPRLLWGRLIRHSQVHTPTVHWLIGPGGVRDQKARLPRQFWTPYFGELAVGSWFRGVVLEYPDHAVWVDPPTQCPDPNDPAARRAAWGALPVVQADKPDVWPSKAGT